MHDVVATLIELRIPFRQLSDRELLLHCGRCGSADRGAHLAVSLAGNGYRCFRNSSHNGHDLVSLLWWQGVDRIDATQTLNRHIIQASVPAPIVPRDPASVAFAWSRFRPASESPHCVAYLERRGFTTPHATADRYDLRFSAEGKWARRLLLPIRIGGSLAGWTGRETGHGTGARYLTEESPGHPILYAPDYNKLATTVILTEGPFDALKTCVGTEGHPFISIALCGKSLSATRLLELRAISYGQELLLFTPDRDVPVGEVMQTTAELRSVMTCPVRVASLPLDCDDPGEIPTEDIVPWLYQNLSIPPSSPPPSMRSRAETNAR